MWTEDFKSSPAEVDDVEEDDVEMTVEGGASSAGDDVEMTVEGGASSAGAPADEDPFEKQMRLSYESQVRASTVRRYDMTSHRLSIN